MSESKKVAVVSCYFQHNYGSMLQAYATQRVLDKLGYENETIDVYGFSGEIKKAKMIYFMKATLTSDLFFSKFGRVKSVVTKKLFKKRFAYSLEVRDAKFEEFRERYFRLSKRFASKKELEDQCGNFYSAVLVGSDQLWLPGNIAADYYTLNFVPDRINSIAYATSFGQAVLPRDSERRAKAFLRRIRHLSVREESGQKLIEKLTGRNAPVVCDPTLLLTGDEWLEIQRNEPAVKAPYIFCYFLGKNALHREFAKKLRVKTGYKIVALLHLDEYIKTDEEYADDTPYDIDPSDFLNLIRNAAYVCTDSFHCTVFSMLYKKVFFTFRRFADKSSTSTNSRLDTLFMLTGLGGRFMRGDEDIGHCLEEEIDYGIVHQKLAEVREYSYMYLLTALADKEDTDL